MKIKIPAVNSESANSAVAKNSSKSLRSVIEPCTGPSVSS